MPLNLTAIILAKNEEKNIGPCIRSMLFAGEVLVIDDGSTDHTVELAKSLGARVVEHAMNGDWGQQQTFALSQAKYDWVFFIDADERMTPVLQQYIEKAIASGEKIAYRNVRLNYFWGQPLKHGGWFHDFGIHLVPKEGTYVTGVVHPTIVHPYPEKRWPRCAHMIHYPYKSWEHHMEKMNLYTTLAAKKYKEAGRTPHFVDIILHPVMAFIKMYILQAGWRDGKIGFIMASLHYFYTMEKYIKFYYLDKSNTRLEEG